MSWTYWGIVTGIISLVAVLLFSILTIYAVPKPRQRRLDIAGKPEPLVQRKAA
jgi:peptidoglycan/LPS O-acetylase OafA/YrhL